MSVTRNILDTRLYRVMETVTEFFLLNLLWLLACLPVVTIYPSTAAMFAVVREWVRGREPGIFGSFYAFFRENFKQSLGIGVVWTVLGALLVVNFGFVGQMPPVFRLPLYASFSLFGLLYAFASVYLFPVMVGFEARWSQVLKNSLRWSVSQPVTTVLCLLVLTTSVAVFLILPVTLLILGSVSSYVIYRLCDRSFQKVLALKGNDRQT